MAPSTVSRELPIAVSAPKLWGAMMDSQILVKALHPVVTSVEHEGDAVVGTIISINLNAELVGFPYFKEKLTAVDESSMTMSRSVIEGGYLGTQFSSQSTTITVKPDGEASSILTWVLDYDPIIDNPEVDQIAERFVKFMVAIEAYLQKTSQGQ